MTACRRPGCNGEIIGGFCDECGHEDRAQRLAGVSAVASAAAPAPALAGEPAVGAGASRQHCERSGCDGTIDDGYCDTCGLAPTIRSQRSAGPTPSAAAPVASSSTVSRGTSTVRRLSTSTTTTGRSTSISSGGSIGNLGAGLVDIPAVPRRDPREAVLADPEVPERKRFCGRCDHPVGRTRGPRPARTEGFCPHCGAVYSFTPKLRPGDLVEGRYLVAGCLAHGGLGWIYLAQDRVLEDSWRVLKGLLDSGDAAAMAAAAAEKKFLTEVMHPNIVRIHNFVQHDGAGYIVMDYVGGESLRDLRVRHREDSGSPLPVADAIAYMLGVLPAMGYLHRQGLLFCDFKPDNVIHTDDQLTLIDLGGVQRMGDHDSDLYGTVGYQAPEVNESGVSIESDLYTVARTLAVLCIDFAGYQDEKRYATRLPPASEVAVFSRYEGLLRFLEKATARDPGERFHSAAEMAEQLVGVLRQVIAIDGGNPAPAPSYHFSAELGALADDHPWQLLPIPAVDSDDPAAGVLATLALVGPDQRQAVLAVTPRSPELSLSLARFAIDEGRFDDARRELETAEARQSGWRATWWRGVLSLAEDRPADAELFFDAVASELPGELAPKLAMAVCSEAAAVAQAGEEPASGDAVQHLNDAVRSYSLVAHTDAGYASASFGLARAFLALGDREGAASALRTIPKSSSAYVTAQVTLCRVLASQVNGDKPALTDLTAASDTLDTLSLDNSTRLPIVRDLHSQAISMLTDGRSSADDAVRVGGVQLDEHSQRSALERTLRSLAKLAATEKERFDLVDEANSARPQTLT
jgi:serine/threonine-protein kinase PknG